MMKGIFPGLDGMLNVHPVFVHFPIVFWLGALLFEALAVLRPARSSPETSEFGSAGLRSSDELHRTAARLLYLGTLTGLLAVGTGLLAQEAVPEKGPAHEVMELHETLMLITTSLALGLSMVAFFLRNNFTPRRHKLFLLGLLAVASLLAIGADRGAQLVYQYGTAVNWPAASPK
jgi:uncharacterized membrane protein